ncbi:hypothetical protein OEB99_01030 [Actinotalea sp. M2MS4P-6]|uniref:hypothetical protein n=1 Tax=Actinotalea sp. M2MS4P-6 TaxID=2983762 RepID=UPI0021E46033|nr:hypothetical protein [Actinotalea sp. M2MS4P-6]MCV2392880.1 hypothetical protein [Actinotalea sp. M2MS4P-6]
MRSPVLVVSILGAVAIAIGALALEPARDAWHQWQAGRSWEQDEARATAAMDAVELPVGYRAVECPDGAQAGAARCWRTELGPAQALPDLRAAVAATGAEVLDPDPAVARDADDDALASSVIATVPGTFETQGFVLVATRDLDDQADDEGDFWTGTTTVRLVPALTPPG